MLDADLQPHLDVTDAASHTSFVLKDQFLNYSFSDPLKDAVRDLTAERARDGVQNFVLDLSAVGFMDSCGLSVLIAMRKAVEQAHRRMIVVVPSPIVLRLLSITRLDQVFEIVATAAEAELALTQPAPASA